VSRRDFVDRPWSAPLVGFLLAVAIAAATLVAFGPPHPRVHDEFCYALAADTFASGRLTNPTHPLWRSFETFHVLSHPSYMAKYHPAQGLFLALGQKLYAPWLGVWLSCGLACAAIAWMIRGVASARASMLGAVIASLIVGASYWSYSYWGGAVAAMGGALLCGGVFRLGTASAESRAAGLAAGVGTVTLLYSRPLEGFLLFLACAALATLRLRKQRDRIRPFLVPWAAVMAIGAAWLLYYNWRVTGSPLLLPYIVWERTYFATPPFVWGSFRPEPPPSSQAYADFAKYNLDRWHWVTDASTVLESAIGRFTIMTQHYTTLPLAFVLPAACFDREHRAAVLFAFAAIGATLVVMLGSLWSFPHYIAPLTGLFVLLEVRGFAVLSRARHARIVVPLLLLSCAVNATSETIARGRRMTREWHQDRARVDRDLAGSGEEHVVVVRYAPGHDFLEEWVYNRADIDGAKVVWAREISADETLRLRGWFPKRKFWLLVARPKGYELTPFDAAHP
jgi:hypothetical protein